MPFAGRHVVLGVSGGIACYKSCVLARHLTERGATVDVVLTASAAEFVRPLTFETLTRRPVLTSLWEPGYRAREGAAADNRGARDRTRARARRDGPC
jgi:phosphopantothenoylcysteine decarboxylase/phosphopantothenate--cysteine ligase